MFGAVGIPIELDYLCPMAKILCLETATTNCSVAIGSNGAQVALIEENSQNYSHSEQLHVFIKESLKQASLSFKDLDAIAVSMGPGSYTGLRIGVSAAKGLCFALGLPLISIPTLQSMARQVVAGEREVIVPLLDARRMEVYSSVFDFEYREVRETRAEIVDENSFDEFKRYNTIYLAGNGSEKCMGLLSSKKFKFRPEIVPSAQEMIELAHKKYQLKRFEDVAYFEPYYLKDFVLQGKKKS